jgi:hypothetical protein
LLTEHSRTATESTLPISVADDAYSMPACRRIIVIFEQAADLRLHSQNREIVAGDKLSIEVFSLALEIPVELPASKTGQPGKHPVVFAEPTEIGM